MAIQIQSVYYSSKINPDSRLIIVIIIKIHELHIIHVAFCSHTDTDTDNSLF